MAKKTLQEKKELKEQREQRKQYHLENQIQEQIDEIILSEANSLEVFKSVLSKYTKKSEEIKFIQTLQSRLQLGSMEGTIEDFCSVRDENGNGVEIHYIYAQQDEPEEKPKDMWLFQNNEEFIFREEFKRIAFENWCDRKSEEAKEIIDYIDELDIPVEAHLIYGLDIDLNKEQIAELYSKLKGKYIKDIDLMLFENCLNKSTLLTAKPKIIWHGVDDSFYYFALKLEGLRRSGRLPATIHRNELFVSSKGIPFTPRNISKKMSKFKKVILGIAPESDYLPKSADELDLIFNSFKIG